MADIPFVHYSTRGLTDDQAFEGWRKFVSPGYGVKGLERGPGIPRGSMRVVLLDSLVFNRALFNPQRLTRDPRLISSTPDNIRFQLYQAGGFRGWMGKRDVVVGNGQTLVVDSRTALDVRLTRVLSMGITVPRAMFPRLDVAGGPHRLDQARDRLLAARLQMLHRQIAAAAPADVPGLSAEVVAFLRRLLDPSPAADVLDGADLDVGLFGVATKVIESKLSSPQLSSDAIADAVGISRASLYRVFGRLGGVMAYVWRQRLDAVRMALADPLDTRSIGQIALDHGFKSQAHLSRAFGARFGATPRDWRRSPRAAAEAAPGWSAEYAERWLSDLSQVH